MYKQIILYVRAKDFIDIRVMYNISSGYINMYTRYLKSNKEKYKRQRELHPDYNKEKYKRQRELHPDYNKENYIKYKSTFLKNSAKRKRQLGYVIIANNIIQDKDIKINQHHINNMLVIPIPEIIHRGNLSQRIKHRELINKHYISEFYPINRVIKEL